jgi:hypothetical protein
VRVEGLQRTLLAPTVVKTHRGWITKGGTPTGACPAAGAAGALDLATRHRWNGTWSAKYQTLLLTSIKGERHGLTPAYWSIWVNDSYAQSGICGITLHRGDRLLFAAVPDTPQEFPIALHAPRTARAGKTFTVKSFWFGAGGRRKPLGGVRVRGGGIDTVTNSRGVAAVKLSHTGTVRLRATRRGYIRAAAVAVSVTG